MTNKVFYKIGQYTAEVIKSTVQGGKLNGMSNGKVFIRDDGNLYINLDDQLHKIEKLKIVNNKGKKVDNIENINFDTDSSVRGILIKRKKLLLHHRVKKGREYYVFPGGHVRLNESPKDTLKREFKEETGLDVEVEDKFMELFQEGLSKGVFYSLRMKGREKQLLRQNPDVKEGEVNEPVWITLSDAKNINILPKKVIEKVIAFNRSS